MNMMFKNRKTLYLVLGIVMVCVFSLTVVYAALNTVLKITGSAEVVASNWDIHLDNVQLVNGSVTTTVPTITNNTTASFTTILTTPGDYYMFTIDVVNNGSIDAMIDSIEKTPTLTESQAKYLNYIVEYQNGESIDTKQLVEANSFVRLKVKVEFRKDIASTDLPSTSETLNLSFKVNYVQADETNTSTIPNSGKLVRVVSGDYDTVGSEICINDECFYVISSTEETVTMLAKYNLYVGGSYDGTKLTAYGDEATGKQNSTMLGFISGHSIMNGTVAFSNINYWDNNGLKVEYGTNYPAYVYDSNSILYTYIENYRTYLSSLGVVPSEARLISYEELSELGCGGSKKFCSNSPSWVYSSTYWTGAASDSLNLWRVDSFSYYGNTGYNINYEEGCRPVITISKNLI